MDADAVNCNRDNSTLQHQPTSAIQGELSKLNFQKIWELFNTGSLREAQIKNLMYDESIIMCKDIFYRSDEFICESDQSDHFKGFGFQVSVVHGWKYTG